MSRGGKREGVGRSQKYFDPVEIRIKLERKDRDLINQYCQEKQIDERNDWPINQLVEKIKD